MITDLTVLMANYNGMPFLKKAVKSIDCSTMLPFEVIIIDDGSTDNSIEYLKKLKPKYKLQIIAKENKGLAHSLNIGIDLINTKYIMRMDTDDMLHPEKIERQYNFLEDNTDIFFVGCNAINFANNYGELSKTNKPENHKKIIKAYMRGDHGMIHATIMLRNQYIKKNKYNENILKGSEYSFIVKLLTKYKLKTANLASILYYVQNTPGSLSKSIGIRDIKLKHYYKREFFGGEYNLIERFREYRDYIEVLFYRKGLQYKLQKSSNYYIMMFLLALIAPHKVYYRLLSLKNK